MAGVDGYRRFARFGRTVWGIAEHGDEAAARAAIACQVAYFKELDMPVSLPELGLGDLDVEALTALCTFGYTRTIGTFRVLDADAIRGVYTASK